jgi:hypothetical protein
MDNTTIDNTISSNDNNNNNDNINITINNNDNDNDNDNINNDNDNNNNNNKDDDNNNDNDNDNNNDDDDDDDDDVNNDDVDFDQIAVAARAGVLDVEEVKSEDEIRAFEEARVAQQNKLNELKDQYKDEQLESVDIRLSYLMQQSEVFAHFLANDGAAAVSADTSKSSTSKKNNTKRKMLSEADEDKQLMQLATSKLHTTRLTQQPSLIQSGQMRSYQLEGLNWLI